MYRHRTTTSSYSIPSVQVQKHEQRLQDKFRTEVSDKCTEEAVVVIYITGLQFPFEVRGGGGVGVALKIHE